MWRWIYRIYLPQKESLTTEDDRENKSKTEEETVHQLVFLVEVFLYFDDKMILFSTYKKSYE